MSLVISIETLSSDRDFGDKGSVWRPIGSNLPNGEDIQARPALCPKQGGGAMKKSLNHCLQLSERIIRIDVISAG